MYLSTSAVFGLLVVGRSVAGYAHNTTNITNTTNTTICDLLSSTLPTTIFWPESQTYNSTITSYPFPQLRLHPKCVIRPRSAEDVSKAVTILAKHPEVKFAIKGGGHNANVGFNNVEDGVTFDMQSLKAVQISQPGVVTAGAGALSQDVYDVTDKHNISVMVGRVGVVGIAGFLTGGGVSFFSPEQGWAADAILNMQVVLSSGAIVNANKTSNSDLFAALKGGQNNFGIVTRFDLRSFPAGPVWGGRITYGNGTEDALLRGFTQFKDPAKYDPYASGWLTFDYNGARAKLFTPVSIMWYTKPEQKPGALGNITNVVPKLADSTVVAPVGEFARNASMAVKGSAKRTIWATTTFRISPTILHRIHGLWKELVPKICEQFPGTASQLTFQAIMPAPKADSPPNSLGFSSTEAPEKDLVFLQIVFSYPDPSASEGLQSALKDFVGIFDAAAEEEGVKHRFVYLNFAAAFQDPFAGYGADSLRGLRRVARRYDPQGVFQKQVGGFKLFNGTTLSPPRQRRYP
ncbi:FAD binding domain-containing protein [Periconia macrospinosa]|uniref:FAD binding domain-containing protein n=1 Tax=Periconia macrospinosa TaxID=97972 RepID=A0A2V1E4B0_9PLEO|nr:FAD binding domain-containing protein [Periconia macrospinosa]